MLELIVGGHFCCAHRNTRSGGDLHGHSYEVRAAFRGHMGLDAEAVQAALTNILDAELDHKTLPDALSLAEDMAAHIGERLTGCLWVEVWRPLERLGARWST